MDVVLQITASDGLDATPSFNIVPLPSGSSSNVVNSFAPGRPLAPPDSSISFPGFDFGKLFLSSSTDNTYFVYKKLVK